MKVVGSSSKGNCYILASDTDCLILEAGVKLSDVKKALDYNLGRETYCLVSHRHGDHAKYLTDIVNAGILTAAPSDVWASKPSTAHHVISAQPEERMEMGPWKIFPLAMAHDVPCLAYVIDHPDMGRLLFATDSGSIPYRIPSLRHLMIECNYSHLALERAIEEGRTAASQRARLYDKHMSLDATKFFLRNNDLSGVSEIVLLHLSSNNSAADQFQREIEALSGLPSYIADKNLILEFN